MVRSLLYITVYITNIPLMSSSIRVLAHCTYGYSY